MTRDEKRRIRAATRRWWGADIPCQKCGAEPAEIHHYDYEADYRDIDNVGFFCRRHHVEAHGGDFRFG